MPKDTIICHYYGRCKNHPVKRPLIDTACYNDSNPVPKDSVLVLAKDSIVEVAIGKTSDPKANTKLTQEAIVKDSIQENIVSLVNDTTYTTEVQIVRINPDSKEPMTYDVQINAIVFVFTAYLTYKYIVASIPCWANLISDLKQELGKA